MSPKLVPQILQLNFVIKFILYLMTLNQIYAGAQYSNWYRSVLFDAYLGVGGRKKLMQKE